MTLILEISAAMLIVAALSVLIWGVWRIWKKQVDLAAELVEVRKTIIALYETQKVMDKRWRNGE